MFLRKSVEMQSTHLLTGIMFVINICTRSLTVVYLIIEYIISLAHVLDRETATGTSFSVRM